MECLFKDCKNAVVQNGVCQKHNDQYDDFYNKFDLSDRPTKQLSRKQRQSKSYLET